MVTGNPGRFAPTSWWWAQSCETGLRGPNSLLTGKPGPKSRRAAEAAEAYWRAAGGEGHYFGKEPLAIWRHHLKKAAASRAKDFRTEWRRHLEEAERRWIRRNSASDAA